MVEVHLLEGGQQGQDGAPNLHRVLVLWQSDDLDFYHAGGQGLDFHLCPIHNAGVHGGPSR